MNHPKFEERESHTFVSAGLKLFGVLHRPLSNPFPPIVLMCHGFAGVKSGKHRMFIGAAENLARAGIASFRFDFSGCGDSEGEFIDMTIGGEVQDTLEAMRYLETDPNLDLSRLGLLGKSLGGLVGVMAAEQQGRVKSIALWAPAFHADQWAKLWTVVQNPATSEDVRRQIMQFDGAHASEHFLREFFGIKLEKHLKQLEKTPLLHIQGELDNAVDMTHAKKYEEHRKEASATTKLVRLPKTDHDFSHPEEKNSAIKHTVSWFLETL